MGRGWILVVLQTTREGTFSLAGTRRGCDNDTERGGTAHPTGGHARGAEAKAKRSDRATGSIGKNVGNPSFSFVFVV